jgi:hypothetical protein
LIGTFSCAEKRPENQHPFHYLDLTHIHKGWLCSSFFIDSSKTFIYSSSIGMFNEAPPYKSILPDKEYKLFLNIINELNNSKIDSVYYGMCGNDCDYTEFKIKMENRIVKSRMSDRPKNRMIDSLVNVLLKFGPGFSEEKMNTQFVFQSLSRTYSIPFNE